MNRLSGPVQSSVLMDAMFGVTIAALFSGLNHEVGPIKIQLSDILAAASIFLTGLRRFSAPRASALLVVILAAYLSLFCISALTVGAINGIKEIIQSFLIFSFVFAAFGYYRTRSTDRLLIIASALIFAILVYNIGWHVAQGDFAGWKRLNEPMTIFILLPLLLILLFERFGDSRHWFLPIVVVLIAALIILLSGERKAYLFGAVAAVIWIRPTSWRIFGGVVLVVPCLWLAASFDQTGYVNRQIASLVNFASGSASQSSLLDENRPTTLSDAQKEFSNRLATEMWEAEPILGMGTNAFSIAIKRNSSIPAEFRIPTHGEFRRALYENGIIGISLYLALWIAAFAQIILAWPKTMSLGDPKMNKIKLLCVTMFLIYCTFAASKGLTLVCICILPYVVALPPRKGQGSTRLDEIVNRANYITKENARNYST